MKKALIFVSLLSVLFLSCASNKLEKNIEQNEAQKAEHTEQNVKQAAEVNDSVLELSLYENCPQNTYALEALISLRASSQSYSSVKKVTLKGKITKEKILPVEKYVAECETIKAAIKKGEGKECVLKFSTSSDGTGETVDFSSENAIISSINILRQKNINEIWAIYNF